MNYHKKAERGIAQDVELIPLRLKLLNGVSTLVYTLNLKFTTVKISLIWTHGLLGAREDSETTAERHFQRWVAGSMGKEERSSLKI